MAEFRNQFSWSFTRHKTFEECLRKYYLNYYAYWGGWSPDADEGPRLTYRLKKMQSLPMWAGDVVHRMIERIIGDLRNRDLNKLEAYQKQIRNILNREWTQSVEGGWRWKPKYNLNLFEHYYGVEITREQRIELRNKTFDCVENFMKSEIFDRLAALRPEEWHSVEKLEQFDVGGVPVFVKLDAATVEDGLFRIYDWKTGRETPDTERQLGCYALYAHQQLRRPVEDQRLVSFYLADDKALEHVPTAEEVIEARDFVMRSAEAMTKTLDGGMEENAASADNFPMTERRGLCPYCFFREVCYKTREWPPPALP